MIRHPSLFQGVFAQLLCNKVVLQRHLLAIISSGVVTFCCVRKRNSVGKSDFISQISDFIQHFPRKI